MADDGWIEARRAGLRDALQGACLEQQQVDAELAEEQAALDAQLAEVRRLQAQGEAARHRALVLAAMLGALDERVEVEFGDDGSPQLTEAVGLEVGFHPAEEEDDGEED